eukprot:358261-Chlamydomonas_euryale.AAC.2
MPVLLGRPSAGVGRCLAASSRRKLGLVVWAGSLQAWLPHRCRCVGCKIHVLVSSVVPLPCCAQHRHAPRGSAPCDSDSDSESVDSERAESESVANSSLSCCAQHRHTPCGSAPCDSDSDSGSGCHGGGRAHAWSVSLLMRVGPQSECNEEELENVPTGEAA